MNIRTAIITAALAAVLFAPKAHADAAHEASAMARMDETVMAISLLPNDRTLILSKQFEAPGLTCNIRGGEFIGYIIDGAGNSERAGCWHMTDDGVQIKWQDGEVTDTPMTAVIVNKSTAAQRPIVTL